MNIAPIIQICGVVSIVSSVIMVRRLGGHIDPERFRESSVDPTRAYSNTGPSYEVLSDRGRKLQALSFVLLGSGLLCIAGSSFFR